MNLVEGKKAKSIKVFLGIDNKYYVKIEYELDFIIDEEMAVKIGNQISQETDSPYFDHFTMKDGRILYIYAGKSTESDLTKPL